MSFRPTRRGLLAGLAGGLFAWLAPKARAGAAPAPVPAGAGGACASLGRVVTYTYDGTRGMSYSTYPGGATTYVYDCRGGPPQPLAVAGLAQPPPPPPAGQPPVACPSSAGGPARPRFFPMGA
jgi:hypothetical protein